MLFRFLLIIACFHLQGLQKREMPVSMKVSVIIPCYSKHFRHLAPLLRAYRMQSVTPDEIVISLSSIGEINPAEIGLLERQSYPFTLKILKHTDTYDAATNRNLASEASTGDLLICQDADDLPHRQRVQIIKYLFEKYQIDFLVHQFVHDETDWTYYYYLHSLEKLCTLRKQAVDSTFYHVAQGCPAYVREVFNKVHWISEAGLAEDGWFNLMVGDAFENSVILQLPIYLYRPRNPNIGFVPFRG